MAEKLQMMTLTYKESQKVGLLAYVLLIPIAGLSAWGIFTIITEHIGIGYLLPICIAGLLLTVLYSTQKLVTEINETGIRFKFRPYMMRSRIIAWEEVKDIDMYLINAQSMVGIGIIGIGIKYTKEGTTYVISSDLGLRIKTRDDEVIIIGTRDKVGMNKVVNQFKTGRTQDATTANNVHKQ